MKLKLIATTLSALAAAAVWGKTLDNGFTYSTESPVVPGEWTTKFAEALKMADEQHIPLVAFWAKSSCGQCKKMERANMHEDVIAWRKERGYLFVFGINDLGESTKIIVDGKEINCSMKSFAKKGSNLPFIAVYWNKDGDASAAFKSRTQFCGREKSMLVTPDASIADADARVADVFMRSVDKIVGDYKPSGGGASGPCGSFITSGSTDFDRLEVESTTKRMYVGLERKPSEATETKAKLSLQTQDGSELSSADVNWTNGQLRAFVEVDVTKFTGATSKSAAPAVEKQAQLLLLDASGATQASNVVNFVTVPNSASNPDFKGCPEFGRWTMDLAAATNLVSSAEGGPAYTLVSVQGSLWCPDCANTDRNFLDLTNGEGQVLFNAWAKDHNVALVTVDIPNFKSETEYNAGGTPSLLSWDAYQTALVRNKKTEYPAISGGDPEQTNMVLRSGAGYLSRKGVTPEEADEWRLRNWDLARKNTAEGGFHRPEDANPRRTGVPIFVLLRKDGTVAARMTDFASVSPMLNDASGHPIAQTKYAEYIKLFDQMLDVATNEDRDATEIENNYPSDGAMVVLTNGVPVEGRLSGVDKQDAIRLGDWFQGNGRVNVELTGDRASDLILNYYKRDKEGNVELVGEANEKTFDFKGVGDCFILVKHTNLTEFAEYTLKATVETLDPDSSKMEYVVQDGTGKVKVNLVKDALYRVENMDAAACSAFFAKASAKGTDDQFFTATAEGTVDLVLADATKPLVIQKWIPGTLGFVAEPDTTFVRNIDEADCGEAGFTNVITLVRDGLSGEAHATVSVNKDVTSLPAFRYQLLDADGKPADSVTLDWTDNGIAKRSFKVVVFGDNLFDGFDRALAFDVAVTGSTYGEVTVGEENGHFALVLKNEDEWWICRNIRVNVAYDIPQAEGIDLKGSLINKDNWPSGISIKIDNEAKRIVASGVTKAKSGIFSGTYRIEAKTSGASFSKDFLIKGHVIDPAEIGTDPDDPEKAYNASCVNARTYKDIPLTQTIAATNGAAAYAVLDGVLKVTIAKGAGKMSAKYTCEAGGISFSSKEGVFIDEATHAFTATMTASSKKFRNYRLTVDALPDGSVESELVVLGNDGEPVKDLCGTACGAPWSKTNPASRWQGYYTTFFEPEWVETNAVYAVSEGRPYLTLKMESKSAINNGTVKWAGMLPNGKGVSGSSALTVDGEGACAYLPAFKKVSKDVFAALMKINPDAHDCKDDGGGAVFSPDGPVYSVWKHVEKKSNDLSYNVYYNVYGAIYDYKSDALDCCCERDYGLQATNMAFSVCVPVPFPESLKYGPLDATSDTLATFNVFVGSDTIEFDDGKTEQWKAKLKFAKKTGAVSGSFVIPFRDKMVKAKYKGVVTIGFGNGCGCHDETLVLPFVNGSWYISDSIGDASGNAVSVKRGGAIKLEVK